MNYCKECKKELPDQYHWISPEEEHYCEECFEKIFREVMKREQECQDTYFTTIGIGIDGVEMLSCTTDEEEARRKARLMDWRARFNSHRNIKLYNYASPDRVTWETLKDKKYLANILKNVTGRG